MLVNQAVKIAVVAFVSTKRDMGIQAQNRVRRRGQAGVIPEEIAIFGKIHRPKAIVSSLEEHWMASQSGTPNTAIVGLQWGDEGKGKFVDVLAAEHDVVVRFNGGANAGHTIVVEGEKLALHLMPSAVLNPNCELVIANGTVIDPDILVKEIELVESRGLSLEGRFHVSSRAHVVLPWHSLLDGAAEARLSDRGEAIGTTKRGIGPAYADKIGRSMAIRMGDLLDEAYLRTHLEKIAPLRLEELKVAGNDSTIDTEALLADLTTLGERLRPYLTDTTWLLHDRVNEKRSLLFEGANACLLDVDHGTYPFVTSSNASALGISPGTGLPAKTLGRVVGVVKAYSTRVGGGPFPTELDDATGDRIRDRGREYGTTTGRPRRCGWIDLVALRYAAMVCGADSLAITLLDVLSGFDEIRLCTNYKTASGEILDRFPPDARLLEECTPVYESHPGWAEEIDQCKSISELPPACQSYLKSLQSHLGVPIEFISVGPDRRQTMRCPQKQSCRDDSCCVPGPLENA